MLQLCSTLLALLHSGSHHIVVNGVSYIHLYHVSTAVELFEIYIVSLTPNWLNVHETVVLSITSMLAALTAEIVIAAKLPKASDMTWIAKFNILSLAFAFMALLECVAVLYFIYKRTEDIILGE